MCRLLLILLLIIALYPVYYIYLRSPPPLPDVDLDEWWGKESLKEKTDDNIKPFTIKFKEVMAKDLKDRLKDYNTLTPPLADVGFEYGFNSKQIDGWVKYWIEKYPFAEREAFLNTLPQFKTNIQGLDIHFIRVTPEVPKGVDIVPLLLLHGWPGSVREFYEAIPLLTAVSKDRNFAIEVIVPSLPGYGYSDKAVRPGLGADKMAVIMRNLMHRLGHKKYYVQGGDWGSIMASVMATLFPKEILGHHTNMPGVDTPLMTVFRLLGSIYPPLVVKPELADRMYPLSKTYGTLLEESGYFHMQSTKPDTLGIALGDSPVGLLAYIFEKFSSWTDMANRQTADGNLTKFTKEQLIDNLMYYWTTSTITSSMRLYSDTFNKRFMGLRISEIPTPVPTWVLQAKHELIYTPPWMMRFKYTNLLGETVLDEGGHFIALELPKVFAKDVIQAITAFRKWHSQNPAKTEL
ncbi:juvenile hormone epoxide hydrolase-like [Epargyreus clarus]|uniref:juvenile hormone epoxide hydrolase-like n=1 Tax=Epargyreus clarus TaxID=520877 RepID=UPI003C2C2379